MSVASFLVVGWWAGCGARGQRRRRRPSRRLESVLRDRLGGAPSRRRAGGAGRAARRIPDNPDGFAALVDLLAAAGDSPEQPVPVAIETPHGLLVAALRATGRPVYASNPMAVARYRDRHSVACAKSDHADALTLANILRTDSHAHRRLPADSALAQSIAVLARAEQDAVWRRTRAMLEVRSLLREYYPTFLAAFARSATSTVTNLASSDARAVLRSPRHGPLGAKLSVARIATALRRGGRKRTIQSKAEAIAAALRTPQLLHPPLVEQALGRQALALLATLNAECTNAEELGQAAIEAFRAHPDYAIITSFPGARGTVGRPRPRRARRRPHTLRRRPRGEGLCRLRAGNQGIRSPASDHAQAGEEQPSGRRRVRLGLRRIWTRRPAEGALLAPARCRRPPCRRAAAPVQPDDRPALLLPADPTAL